MSSGWNRRDVVKLGVATGVGAVGGKAPAIARPRATRPVAVASANGMSAAAEAIRRVRGGADTLDAVIAGVNLVEQDPEDTSVGYGGLPNEDGVVQLDASVMHGPSGRAGAVAAIEGVRTPSKVARLVAYRTEHVLIVGEGANRFARAHGFGGEELLTDRAREAWLRWKENLSERDGWLPPSPQDGLVAAGFDSFLRHHGTINCNVVDAGGDVSGVTTTSGLAFKIPGRVGDSPIIGAGLYVDNAVGACGSTGLGEANLVECSCFLVVENMRNGGHPTDAAIAALRRVAEKTAPRRRDESGRPAFDLRFYCVNKAGEYGAASMYGEDGGRPARFAVNDGGDSRLEDCAALFDTMG